MEADWEVEIGGGAPVIEAEWHGLIDLWSNPKRAGERIVEIDEAASFPALGALLLALNADGSPIWTSKCDLWTPEPAALAVYVDMLPRAGKAFASWQLAEAFCRDFVANLERAAPPKLSQEYNVDLVIRQAIAGEVDGFGITAYLSASAGCRADAEAALATIMAAFADALPPAMPG
ncbi:MAG TPA: hypothetical protein VMW15_14665 [Terracidiphilus sp.]|jgi:hypothetical protein|nr:hypothetical protein [Terracidiphilus sp.]